MSFWGNVRSVLTKKTPERIELKRFTNFEPEWLIAFQKNLSCSTPGYASSVTTCIDIDIDIVLCIVTLCNNTNLQNIWELVTKRWWSEEPTFTRRWLESQLLNKVTGEIYPTTILSYLRLQEK